MSNNVKMCMCIYIYIYIYEQIIFGGKVILKLDL